jgi:hypothetical protein
VKKKILSNKKTMYLNRKDKQRSKSFPFYENKPWTKTANKLKHWEEILQRAGKRTTLFFWGHLIGLIQNE